MRACERRGASKRRKAIRQRSVEILREPINRRGEARDFREAVPGWRCARGLYQSRACATRCAQAVVMHLVFQVSHFEVCGVARAGLDRLLRFGELESATATSL